MTRFQIFSTRLTQAKTQFKAGWKDALLAGIAAAISWFISQNILGHPNPIFAGVTALICLAPGLPSHGRQSVYVLTGVLTGVFIGEATLLLPPMPIEVGVAIVGFIAMAVASCYAVVPAIVIQAGVSAVMAYAMGPEVAGFTRLLDVAVGAGIGLLFSQVLFTPNVMHKFNLSVERFFHELSNNYMFAERALMNLNAEQAGQALRSCGRTHIALIALIAAIDVAKSDVRWTLRGRFSSREVTFVSTRYDRSGIRLYASSLLFFEALATALRKQRDAPPDWLFEAVELVKYNSLYLAGESKKGQEFIMPDRSKREEPPISWRECARDIEMIENILARLYKGKTHKKRLLAFRRKKILASVREELASQRQEQEKDWED